VGASTASVHKTQAGWRETAAVELSARPSPQQEAAMARMAAILDAHAQRKHADARGVEAVDLPAVAVERR
jgi:hypothetical protein